MEKLCKKLKDGDTCMIVTVCRKDRSITLSQYDKDGVLVNYVAPARCPAMSDEDFDAEVDVFRGTMEEAVREGRVGEIRYVQQTPDSMPTDHPDGVHQIFNDATRIVVVTEVRGGRVETIQRHDLSRCPQSEWEAAKTIANAMRNVAAAISGRGHSFEVVPA